MRISLVLESEHPIELPIQYNHILQGFLYKNLTDRDYREFLHHTGFGQGFRRFKLFTYSRLMGTFHMNKAKNTIVFQSPVEVVIASVLEPFITDLAETLIKADFNFLGQTRVKVKSINVHRDREFGDEVRIKMLSPMVAYNTVYKDGRKYTEYKSPWQEGFSRLIHNNLLQKYRIIYGREPENTDLKIIPTGNQEKKMGKVMNYKGTVIKGYNGIYWLQGTPELIEVAYNTGLGSKNSQGFGCWEVAG